MDVYEVINKMKADKVKTACRGTSHKKHRNYTNKYTQCLGAKGYKGIKKNGYFSKFYSYGVVGHCAIGVQAWFIWCGLGAFVPKSRGYIWNTNNYMTWLKKEPYIKKYGRVKWTTNPARAEYGAVCFKGKKGEKKATHTCIYLYTKGNYIYTVNFNVWGKYKGKKVNNGTVKKYHKSRIKGFACMPYPSRYTAGKTYTLVHDMNVRAGHSSKTKRIRTLAKGTKVKAIKIYKTNNGAYWVNTSYGWICARTPKNLYMR